MNTRKKILALMIAVWTAFLFSACVTEASDMDTAWLSSATETAASTKSSSSSASAVTSVFISGSSKIAYNGSGSLTASVTTSGTPTITYTWSVTSGSDYASVTGNGESATVKGTNETDSEQSVTVQLSVSDGTNTITATREITVTKNGDAVTDKVESVSISATSSTISATGTSTLSAAVTTSGNPSVSYEWQIESGSDYAELSSTSGSSVTITGKNTEYSDQEIGVKVTASDGTYTATASLTITVSAKKQNSDSYISSATVDTTTYSNVLYVDLGSGLISADNSDWTEITTSAVQPISGIKVKYTEDDSDNSTGLIRINASSFSGSLAVYLSGKMTTGGVKIQSNGSDIVALYLNGAEITSSNYPCLEVTKGSAAIVDISGTNTFVDGRSYGTGYGEEYSTTSGSTYTDDDGNTVSCTVVKTAVSEGSDSKGSLYAKGSLTITGSGSLSVTQAYKNCIASKEYLTVEGGTYILTSTGKSGLYGDQGVYVKGGSVTFTGTGAVSSSAFHKAHGINTDDETYTSSFVNVTGGSLNFTTTYGKGISAPVVNIFGGTHVIKVSSPTTKVLNTSSSYYTADGVSSSETVSFAPQGIDGGSVTVSGGTTTITAPWSGINSDGTVNISGGSLTITTSGSGVYDSSESDYDTPACIKADGNIVISGGSVSGTSSGNGGKGIKADGTYTQTAGSVDVKVTGSNLGSSSSSSSFRPGSSSSSSSASASAKSVKIGGAISVSGGKLYATSSSHEAIESKSTITISGGEVYGYSASDDGINASSTFTISGGYVCGYAPSNDGLDANGNFYIKGGLVFAVCSSSPEVAIDANTESNYKLYIQGGTIITLGPLESGATLSQSCYKTSWSANTTYGVTVGSTTYVFTTPSSTSGYGSGLVVSGASTPTVTKGASSSGATSLFDGKLYEGGSEGSTKVTLSSYSSSGR